MQQRNTGRGSRGQRQRGGCRETGPVRIQEQNRTDSVAWPWRTHTTRKCHSLPRAKSALCTTLHSETAPTTRARHYKYNDTPQGPQGAQGPGRRYFTSCMCMFQHTSHLSVTLTAPSAQPHLIVCCSVISAPRMRAHQVTSLASGLSSSDHRASALKHWAQSTMRGGEPRGLAGAPR